ncbi:hypothetical protein WJX72_005228 [[Myrmecia] bisecta]|uniref:Uncharacterized protein n=1 Tax=[Myrmecia] bisecta TaxID=41462 RepID=A0AAW1P3H8_9CHLO
MAVACGRLALIITSGGEVERQLELSASGVGPAVHQAIQLAWLDSDVLAAACPGLGMRTWIDRGSRRGPIESNYNPSQLAVSASHQHVAAACGQQVLVWSLHWQDDASDCGAHQSRLGDYDAEVTCLDWDSSSRLLATAEGAEATVWDMQAVKLLGGDRRHTIVCCGHEARSQIVGLAFQTDGPLLATCASDSQVLLFDSAAFNPGSVSSPIAATHLGAAGMASIIKWMAGGTLVLCQWGSCALPWRGSCCAATSSVHQSRP